ncbi:MAG: stage III sporulation protein SpoIIIAB [Sarcina sp.]
MLKILILVAITLVCSLIGYIYGETFKKRYLELLELMRGLVDMENEILYSYKAIPEVLANVSNKLQDELGTVFFEVSELLIRGKFGSINAAFNHVIEKNKDTIALKEEDLNILLDLSKSLGDTDISGQEQIFSLAKEKLSRVINIAETEYRINYKMYRRLGVGIGVMLAIFLI